MTDSLWMSLTIGAYTLAYKRKEEKLKYRYVDEIAKSLLEHYPNSAHLHALERLNTVGELQTEMWRQVLTELDKLQGENNANTELHKTQ
jgi:cell wall assembly regulator SMI1